MPSYTVPRRTKNEMLGFAPMAVAAAGSSILKSVSAWHSSNIAKARAEDAANRQKAFDWFDGPTPMGHRDKKWGSEYIVKNRTFYDPELVAQAWAYVVSEAQTKDPHDPAMLERATKVFPQTSYSTMQNVHAEFIHENPQYYPKGLVDMAIAYILSGGKSYDVKVFKEPVVNVSPTAGPPAAVPGALPPAGPSVTTAAMFGGSIPILLVSGIVIFTVYKIFLEKPVSRRKR